MLNIDRGKLFTDGNCIKECMVGAENDLFPENGTISLSASSVVQITCATLLHISRKYNRKRHYHASAENFARQKLSVVSALMCYS